MNSKVTELISQITILGMEVSQTTKNDIFVKYSGHVDLFEVDCVYGGYNENSNIDHLISIYRLKQSINSSGEKLIRNLEDVIEKLNEMKKEPYEKVQ